MSAQERVTHTPLLYRIMAPLVLVCITIATYYPSLYYNFQFDDIANIQKHFYIRHHQFKSLFLTGARWISYWLNSVLYSISKFEPFWYRVSSLSIHLINGTLLFFVLLFVLSRCKGASFFRNNSWYIAVVTTALFLLHPVQTQTVSYVIQGQLEGLACMFILGIILTFLHMSYATSVPGNIFLFALLMVLAIISCGTKEIAIISPVLVMLVDWFFVAQGSLRSFKKRWWVHALLLLVVTSFYVYLLKPSFFTNILGFKLTVKNNIGNMITQQPNQTIDAWSFFISQFKVILHYIWIFIWPFNMSVEYDWVLVRGFFAWDCLLPLLALLAIGALLVRVLMRDAANVWCFGALWFFICLAPRSSIVPSPELLVDYKTYTASIGWLLILSTALVKLIGYTSRFPVAQASRRSYQLGQLCSCFLMVPLSFATWHRNLVWSSGSNFWMNVIKNAPGKARAYNNYGVELSQNLKMYKEAIPYFKKAAQMDGSYPDPLNNVAVCYSFLNQIDSAIEALKQGLRINRLYPEGHNNLGSFYLQQKMYKEAEASLKNALQLRPYYGKAYINMGRLYAAQGDMKTSLDYFKKACTVADLDNEVGYKLYGQAAAFQNEFEQAIWAFTKTLECNPGDLESLFSLANCYYMSNQYEMSAAAYQRLLALNSDDMRAWYNLGECYFAQNDITKAYQCFKRVEPHWQRIPQVRLKLASCYEKTNDPLRAHQELRSFFASPQAPAALKVKAQELIAKLEEHYPQIRSVGLVA